MYHIQSVCMFGSALRSSVQVCEGVPSASQQVMTDDTQWELWWWRGGCSFPLLIPAAMHMDSNRQNKRGRSLRVFLLQYTFRDGMLIFITVVRLLMDTENCCKAGLRSLILPHNKRNNFLCVCEED